MPHESGSRFGVSGLPPETLARPLDWTREASPSGCLEVPETLTALLRERAIREWLRTSSAQWDGDL